VPLQKKIDQLKMDRDTRQKEQDFIAFQMAEIEAADIQPGEDEVLEKKKQSLANASRIFEMVNRSIHDIHDKEGSMVETLSALTSEMQRYSDSDEQIEQLYERLSSICYDLQDATSDLRDFSAVIDLDPASLEQTEQRLDLIAKLKRKYGGSLAALFDEYEALKEKHLQTAGLTDEIAALEQQAQVDLTPDHFNCQRSVQAPSDSGQKIIQSGSKAAGIT
jgi:DNA repair protein RecN (Recombination protein N)